MVKDDFPETADAIAKPDAIVLGVPNYYDVPNGLSHCLLEPCFCFRYQGAFLLRDKPVVVFSTGYSADEENSQLFRFNMSNK